MTSQGPKEPVREVTGAWAEAFVRNDPQALSSLYTQDAFFYGSKPELLRGREGALYYFSSLPARDSAEVEFTDIEAIRLTDDAISSALIGRFKIDGAALGPVRFTFVIVREKGAWRISSHHASPQVWN
ncbi:MAG: SgcJ/EcaC family oxidoreductase [Flavobacteriaceae bacterium]